MCTPIRIVGYGLAIFPRITARPLILQLRAAGGGRMLPCSKSWGSTARRWPALAMAPQAMGAWAAQDCLQRTGVDARDRRHPERGRGHKEFPLTTTGIYIQHQIGAHNAWAIDLQQRCNTTVAALRFARDLLLAEPELKTVLIAGGYRQRRPHRLRRPHHLLHVQPGGRRRRLPGAEGPREEPHPRRGDRDRRLDVARRRSAYYGGTQHADREAARRRWRSCGPRATRPSRCSSPAHEGHPQRDRLHQVDAHCLDKALAKSGKTRQDLGYLNILHFKPSMHAALLDELGLREDQSYYLGLRSSRTAPIRSCRSTRGSSTGELERVADGDAGRRHRVRLGAALVQWG